MTDSESESAELFDWNQVIDAQMAELIGRR